MIRKCIVGLTVTAAIVVSMGLVLLEKGDRTASADAGPKGPRALLVTDLGDCQADHQKMEASGWSVKAMSSVDVESLDQKHRYEGGLRDYSVIWVPAKENYQGLRRLMRNGGPMDRYARRGGLVAVMDVTPAPFMMDIAPGGTDARALPAGGAGAVQIKAIDHPVITGYYIGGMPVVPQSLDPEAKGGRAAILNLPKGSDPKVVAANSIGPVVVEYSHGAGRVFISALRQEQGTCRSNVLLYLQSIAK